MIIREKDFTIEYLYLNVISFNQWQILAEKCFDTDCIDYINAVMNAKIIFYSNLQKKEYNKTFNELNLHKINILDNLNKAKLKRKIHA